MEAFTAYGQLLAYDGDMAGAMTAELSQVLDIKPELRAHGKSIRVQVEATDNRNLGSLSKVFAAGIRIGWVNAESGVLQRFLPAKEAADLCTSNLTQLIAEEYMAGDRWRPNLAALVDIYRGRRDACVRALEETFPADSSWTHPQGGFYVWVYRPGRGTC